MIMMKGQESLGMPLVFSLSSALKDGISQVVLSREERRLQAESDKKQAEVEVCFILILKLTL